MNNSENRYNIIYGMMTTYHEWVASHYPTVGNPALTFYTDGMAVVYDRYYDKIKDQKVEDLLEQVKQLEEDVRRLEHENRNLEALNATLSKRNSDNSWERDYLYSHLPKQTEGF